MLIFCVSFLYLLLHSSAWAYVDPGSGMLIWQGVLAAIGAILVFLRNPLQVIKSWFRFLRRK
jgi:hypothetical protein